MPLLIYAPTEAHSPQNLNVTVDYDHETCDEIVSLNGMSAPYGANVNVQYLGLEEAISGDQPTVTAIQLLAQLASNQIFLDVKEVNSTPSGGNIYFNLVTSNGGPDGEILRVEIPYQVGTPTSINDQIRTSIMNLFPNGVPPGDNTPITIKLEVPIDFPVPNQAISFRTRYVAYIQQNGQNTPTPTPTVTPTQIPPTGQPTPTPTPTLLPTATPIPSSGGSVGEVTYDTSDISINEEACRKLPLTIIGHTVDTIELHGQNIYVYQSQRNGPNGFEIETYVSPDLITFFKVDGYSGGNGNDNLSIVLTGIGTLPNITLFPQDERRTAYGAVVLRSDQLPQGKPVNINVNVDPNGGDAVIWYLSMMSCPISAISTATPTATLTPTETPTQTATNTLTPIVCTVTPTPTTTPMGDGIDTSKRPHQIYMPLVYKPDSSGCQIIIDSTSTVIEIDGNLIALKADIIHKLKGILNNMFLNGNIPATGIVLFQIGSLKESPRDVPKKDGEQKSKNKNRPTSSHNRGTQFNDTEGRNYHRRVKEADSAKRINRKTKRRRI